MISFRDTPSQIRTKTKTVTRRNNWRHAKIGMQLRGVNRLPTKQNPHPKTICFVEITAVDLVRVRDIDQADCDAEGFPELDPIEFIALYCTIHKKKPHDWITRIEFEYIRRPSGLAW
tara:strand:+ start:13482 stop:13832 length:351 start_codon:yes stop_codon:yes gene_type:complete